MGKPYMLNKCLKNLQQLKNANLHIFFVSVLFVLVLVFSVIKAQLSSSHDIDFSQLLGKVSTETTISSQNTLEGQSAQVDLEEGTVLKTKAGNPFTGTLHSPKFLDASVANELS